MADATVLFVGESPPPGAAPGFRPFECASGTRLARGVLGLVDRVTLLEHVPLVNLFDAPTGPKGTPVWPTRQAEEHAAELLRIHAQRGVRSFVLLGSRVATAFGMEHLPGPASLSACPQEWISTPGSRVIMVRAPHPSGASTTMNAPDVVRDVRRVLLPELVLGCPTLRPWHFRLDDPSVLADLASAVSPLRPSVGVAALEWAAAQHKVRLASPPGSLLARIIEGSGVQTDHPPNLPPRWDEPLADTMRDLLQGPAGVERLSARWDLAPAPSGGTKARKTWLARQVDAMDEEGRKALDGWASTPAARATILRYAFAGAA